MSSALLKTILHNTIAEGLYREIVNRTSRYYYYLGQTLDWTNEEEPSYPVDSYLYEQETRKSIIAAKEISPADVSFIVPRIDWEVDTTYDMYDDQYSDQVLGIDLSTGGTGYTAAPIVTITGGGGSGATAEAIVDPTNGNVTQINLLTPGSGYTSAPTVELTGVYGSGATATAVVNVSPSGKQKLEDCQYYVLTDEFNVYKCLDNNNNAPSTVKPYGTVPEPILLNDGYVWKFMYTIPIALRNKFLTYGYMPITNSLRSQFYSSGKILKISIVNQGSGYSYANATVFGDGFASGEESNITVINVLNGGTGYTSSSVLTIDPPVQNTAQWVSNMNVVFNQFVATSDNVYKVVVAGTMGTVQPSHRSGYASNGTAYLQYVGSIAKGELVLSGSSISSVILLGSVKTINVTAPGSGYSVAPAVTVGTQWVANTAYTLNQQIFYGSNLYTVTTDGTTNSTVPTHASGTVTNGTAALKFAGFAAKAYSVITAGGKLSKIIITDSGTGYRTAPTISVGTLWAANTSLVLNTQVYYSNRLYTVTVAGTTDTTAPTHATGSATNGTATLQYIGTVATAESTLRYGYGYNSIPQVTANIGTGAILSSETQKTNATLVPIIENGAVVDVAVEDPGEGYTYANVSIGGDGSGASVSIDLSVGDVNTLQANIELLTVDGAISAIKPISGGYGYSTATVVIDGDGVGASAEAVILDGRITKINMTNYGSGYRWATIAITSASGTGATARAIISPFGGHGKDAINELYARTLMFYSSISNETNQGFIVNNDYRQFGIIKSSFVYGDSQYFTEVYGTSCWAVGANIVNVSNFPDDSIVTRQVDNKRFRIITTESYGALLQSIDNAEIQIGDTLSSSSGNSFNVKPVTPPDLDKYSGDFMYVDNRKGFTPTDTETISFRTIIKF